MLSIFFSSFKKQKANEEKKENDERTQEEYANINQILLI